MHLSYENELILHCAQVNIPPDKIDRVKKLISRKPNWDKVLSFALSGGIAPLLYNSLKRIRESSLIPPHIMDQLKEAYVQNLARNTYLCIELRRILASFNNEDIDAVVLKGATLAGIVYPDIGLRVFNDLDILVKKNDLPAAEKIMSKLNYATNDSKEIRNYYRKNHHHLAPYIHPEKSTIVEIHWNISPYIQIDIDDWWNRVREATINDYKALILCPDDMLLHLCLHLFSSGYTGNTLRGICDIAETLKYYSQAFNWRAIRTQIEKYNISKEVYSILYVSKLLYGNDGNPLNSIDTHNADLSLVSLMQKMALSQDKTSTVPGSVIKAIAAEHYSEKFDILKRKIFPDRKQMSIRYNVSVYSFRLYFCYLLRIIELCIKYGKAVLATLLNNKKNIILSRFGFLP